MVSDETKIIKIRRLIETIIRRAIVPQWSFTQNGRALVYMSQGLTKLPGLFGVDKIEDARIVDYIVYQIYRSRKSIEQNSWRYEWLFSDNAIDKYRKQFLIENAKSGMNYYIDRWLDEYEMSRNQLVSIIADPKTSPLRHMVYIESEEPIKQRFLNTPEGLSLCQAATTGWSPLSFSCGRCDNWVECGKLTAKKYPELMRLRKEIHYGRKEKR